MPRQNAWSVILPCTGFDPLSGTSALLIADASPLFAVFEERMKTMQADQKTDFSPNRTPCGGRRCRAGGFSPVSPVSIR